MSRTLRRAVFPFACVASLMGCDHATKVAAESALRDRPPIAVLPGVIDLTYTENRDVAFDAFARLSLHPPTLVLVVFAVSAIAGVLVAWLRRQDAPWQAHAAFVLIVGGALGNVFDRLARGRVVDFIHVRFWPVFNVADVLVVAGAVLLLVLQGGRSKTAAS